MDFTALKTAIQNAIKLNGNEEITGDILQGVLLSMVSTLGDSAINDLVTAISNEATARQNGDSTLNGYIEALQGAVNSINTAIGNGFVYAGIATPATTPATGKVFYLALNAGTYTNFGNIEVSQGINILKYNGSTWSLDAFIGIDDAPTPSSNNLVKSGGVFDKVMADGSAFDISAHFASGGTLATYADLSAALTALNTLSAAYKKGGMSIKFVQSSDNKYVLYRLMSDTFNTTEANWQGVDNEPTAGSNNLVKSGGVAEKINQLGQSYDAVWEVGDINTGTGVPVSGDRTLRLKNYQYCLPNTTYLIDSSFNNTPFGYLYEYTNEKVFIGFSTIRTKTFTTDNNASFFKIVLSSSYGTTYNDDVNIVTTHIGKEVQLLRNDLNSLTPIVETGDKIAEIEVNGILKKIYNKGTNILDQSFEVGDISTSTGLPQDYANTLRSQKYSACLPSTKYHFKSNYVGSLGYMYCYDRYYNFLGFVSIDAQNTATTKVNSAYLKLVLASGYGTTYNNDVEMFQPNGIGSNIIKLQNGIKPMHQFEADWEIGDIGSNGKPIAGNNNLRTKDFIDCSTFDKFSVTSSYSETPLGYLYYYDSKYNFISGSIVSLNKGEVTKNPSASFFKIVLATGYGTTYNNNVFFRALFDIKSITYIVAKDGSGDYTKLTDAVADAKSGDIIFVKRGVYDHEEVEAAEKTITIIGEDRYSTIIKGDGDYLAPPLEMASGVLKNITIWAYGDSQSQSGRYAYAMHSDYNILANNTFVCEDVTFRTNMGHGAVGFGLRGGCKVLFQNCDFISDNNIAFFMNETVTKSGYNQASGIQELNIIGCRFMCNGAGQRYTIDGNYVYGMAEFEGYKSADSLVKLTMLNNVFSFGNNAPVVIFHIAPEQYWDGGDNEGNIVIDGQGHTMTNWILTNESYGNNIESLNIAIEGNINGLTPQD